MNEVYIPKVILIDKESGKQFEVNLQSDIKPWPTEPAEEEPAQRMVFNKTVTIKMPKKMQQAFLRMHRKGRKYPRKLKKAMKHMEFKGPRFEEIKTQNGIGAIAHYEVGPKEGYPHTKWIFRAAHIIRKHIAYQMKTRLNTTMP